MDYELPTVAPAKDRRVRRSRASLIEAAIALVAERGTAAVPLSDIAEAADVSRQLVYQHFGDRDTLLLEAAYDLVRRELVEPVDAGHPTGRDGALAASRHFAQYRAFYRAVLTSPCGFALNKALSVVFLPINRQAIERWHPGELDEARAEDLAVFLTGGAAAFINTWLIEAPDPLDPERFTDRLMDLFSMITTDIIITDKE